MKIIGLTGGIGSGKSTVSEHLETLGYKIVDADKIARQILEKGSPTLDKIVEAFGSDVLDNDGQLRRKYLAEIAFTNKDNEKKLNDITHSEIGRIIKLDIKNYAMLEAEYLKNRKENLENTKKLEALGDFKHLIIIDAPLLFEAGIDKYCDFTWVVSADLDLRLNRVMQRDKTTKEDVLNRINCQMDENEKCALADEVIYNSQGKEELFAEVDKLLTKYDK